MKKGIFIYPLLMGCLFLSGCSENKFVEEAKKNEQMNLERQAESSAEEHEKEEREKQIYKELERPLEEVVKENQKETMELANTEFKLLDSYTDHEEFSAAIAKILYEFYTLKIDAQEYYEFMKNHGSKTVVEQLPSEKDAIATYELLQDMYRQQNINGDSYVHTKVKLDKNQREGYFYRKVVTTNGTEYYITTIVKEDDEWKFLEDSPSPPFELAEASDSEQENSDHFENGTNDEHGE